MEIRGHPALGRLVSIARPIGRPVLHAARASRFHAAQLFGQKGRYAIAAGYHHRDHADCIDDTANTDEWQREVYIAAREIMVENGLRSVCDVGCGSAYKLVHFLGEFETIGLDLPHVIERAREQYPTRTWHSGSFENLELPRGDLVICADVIEHVGDPDALMCFLISVAKDRIVISTPARDVFYPKISKYRFGPPWNPAHLREWTRSEFRSYVGRFLDIERHEITNFEQATQMVVARLRSPAAAE